MYKQKFETILEISNEIDLIIENKQKSEDYKNIFLDLLCISAKDINFEGIDVLCQIILKIAKTKNRIIRSLEKEFWHFLKSYTYKLFTITLDDSEEINELEPNKEYTLLEMNILSRILDLIYEILQFSEIKSKGDEIRMVSALNILDQYSQYFEIEDVLETFEKFIFNKNENVQNAVLKAIAGYYNMYNEEISDELLEKIETIFDNTYNESIVYYCLQIKINAGIIDEMEALYQKEDWEDKIYGFKNEDEEDENEEDLD